MIRYCNTLQYKQQTFFFFAKGTHNLPTCRLCHTFKLYWKGHCQVVVRVARSKKEWSATHTISNTHAAVFTYNACIAGKIRKVKKAIFVLVVFISAANLLPLNKMILLLLLLHHNICKHHFQHAIFLFKLINLVSNEDISRSLGCT